MKKLILIFVLLISTLCQGQLLVELEALRQEQIFTITDYYPTGDAASVGTEANAVGGWDDQNNGIVPVTSTDRTDGAWSLDLTAEGWTFYPRAELNLSLNDATTYDITIWAKKGTATGTSAIFRSWTGFTSSPNDAITATIWTEYNFTLTTSGTAQLLRVYSSYNEGNITDQVLIDKITITEQ